MGVWGNPVSAGAILRALVVSDLLQHAFWLDMVLGNSFPVEDETQSIFIHRFPPFLGVDDMPSAKRTLRVLGTREGGICPEIFNVHAGHD